MMDTTVVKHFPLRHPDSDAGTFYTQFWQTNMVIHARTREVAYAEHVGPLSIKCAFRGQEIYEYSSGRFAVDERSYLLLNEAQPYSSYIQSNAEVESFSLFFRPSFAAEILASLVTPADKLLDDPRKRRLQPLLFFEKLYRHDAVLTPSLLRLRASIEDGGAGQGWLEEQFHLLLEKLLQVHRNVDGEIEKLPALRRATRIELYRRLHRAKDFMDSSFEQKLGLSTIASIACLSTHHFLRLFRETFRETPHQYLTRRRLEAARESLAHTDESVMHICLSVGFENASSFSRIFRRCYGVSPATFRRMQKKAISAQQIRAPHFSLPSEA
jgi:AraC family transcriptional regulator